MKLNSTPTRLQRTRTRKLVSPNGLPVVYVGRPTKWGNPFKVADMPVKRAVHHYERWLNQGGSYFRISDETYHRPPSIQEIKRELAGKNLACWCAEGSPCHADVLLKIANA